MVTKEYFILIIHLAMVQQTQLGHFHHYVRDLQFCTILITNVKLFQAGSQPLDFYLEYRTPTRAGMFTPDQKVFYRNI